jgi:hypothetical protein
LATKAGSDFDIIATKKLQATTLVVGLAHQTSAIRDIDEAALTLLAVRRDITPILGALIIQ